MDIDEGTHKKGAFLRAEGDIFWILQLQSFCCICPAQRAILTSFYSMAWPGLISLFVLLCSLPCSDTTLHKIARATQA
jgi:hypothetical protein